MGRLSLVAEKRQVNAMSVALTSLFKNEVLDEYLKTTDEALKETDWRKVVSQVKRNGTPKQKRGHDQSAVDRTMKELSKLNVLLQGG